MAMLADADAPRKAGWAQPAVAEGSSGPAVQRAHGARDATDTHLPPSYILPRASGQVPPILPGCARGKQQRYESGAPSLPTGLYSQSTTCWRNYMH